MEINGENWVIPVDAHLQYDIDVESEAIALRSIMLSVSSAKSLGLIILDASRDNPFARKMKLSNRVRSMDRGLARVEPGDNILVSYAARPGTIALDGPGPHSVFTEVLLKNFEIPGLEINYMFRNVHDEVLEATDDEQEPAHYGSLSEKEIYLRPAPTSLTSKDAEPEAQQAGPPVDEIAWSFLRESSDPVALADFVHQFPASAYVADARQRIASLQNGAQHPQSGAPPRRTRSPGRF